MQDLRLPSAPHRTAQRDGKQARDRSARGLDVDYLIV